MTQDEAIIIKKREEYHSALDKIEKKLKDIENGLKLGKKLHLTEEDLRPWKKLQTETLQEEQYIKGCIANLENSCKHEFEPIGGNINVFGSEVIYQCKKCGYRKVVIN